MVYLSMIPSRRLLSVCLALLALLGASAVFLYWRNAIRVNVTNNTDEPITDILIEYRGGNLKLSRILPGGTASGYLYPETESNMSISYVSTQGDAYHELDCYMEPGYRGTYFIDIHRDGVSLSGRTRPSFP